MQIGLNKAIMSLMFLAPEFITKMRDLDICGLLEVINCCG